MSTPARTCWLLVLGLCAWGCAEIPASNPHDPAAPSSAQAPGRVEGGLALPADFAADRLAAARGEARLGRVAAREHAFELPAARSERTGRAGHETADSLELTAGSYFERWCH